jgi:hypothetical protein
MKKANPFYWIMGLAIALQAILGVLLTVYGIYADMTFYTGIDGFFLHFFAVPGVVLLLCLFHFRAFKEYKRTFDFVTTSGYIAFVMSVTGEILVLFYNQLPNGFLGYAVFLVLAAAATALAIMILNTFYLLGYRALKKEQEQQDSPA